MSESEETGNRKKGWRAGQDSWSSPGARTSNRRGEDGILCALQDSGGYGILHVPYDEAWARKERGKGKRRHR